MFDGFCIEPFFLQENPDCSECHVCKEPIYGNQYRMCFKLKNGRNGDYYPSDIKLCESCFEANQNT